MAEKDEGKARKPETGKAAKAGKSRKSGAQTKPAGKTSTRKTDEAAQEAPPQRKRASQGVKGAAQAREREKSYAGGKETAEEAPATAAREEHVEAQGEREAGEEEFRRILEESLERVTVADVVLTMMNQLASMGYLRMGLPENVNLRYRDLDQALLAIDTLEAMLKGAEGKVSEDELRPFRGVLANLQLNFVQISRG